MKICVLFGSFNPLTNAHVTALRAAVNAIGADKGLGVERNVNKTIELWETASEERCRYYDVMLKLGHLYGDGVEMEPNYEKALHWWHQLAENDSGEFGQEGAWAEAMYQLACYY